MSTCKLQKIFAKIVFLFLKVLDILSLSSIYDGEIIV